MSPAQYLDNPLVMKATFDAIALHHERVKNVPVSDLLPRELTQWLARVRLLEGVPFAHLVPDSDLLPAESIRFFYIDRDWTDALVQGALSVGTVTTVDRQQLQLLHARIRDEVDAEERRVRVVGTDPGIGTAGTVSGFLLRSRLVSGWPALHVRAYNAEIGRDDTLVAENDQRRIRLLRLERLAPAVLLCLFDGVPQLVHIEEPRQGVQFGVNLRPAIGNATGAWIPLRDVTTALDIDPPNPNSANPPPHSATIPFRKGGPGVVHVTELVKRIGNEPQTKINVNQPGVQPAEFAIQMLRFPYRQVFGDTTKSTEDPRSMVQYADVFRPRVAIDVMRTWTSVVPT